MESILKSLYGYIEKYVDWDNIIDFISQHRLSVAASVVAVYGLWFLKRPRNLPPGPYGYPIVGSLPAVFGDFSENLKTYKKKYGDVFCLWFGSNRYFIFLNSYEAIKEVYVNRGAEFSDRIYPLPGFELDETVFNIKYNDSYKASRKIGTGGLRNAIVHRMDSLMDREFDKCEEYLRMGEDIDMNPPTVNVLANIVLESLFRKSYPHNHPDIADFQSEVKVMFSGFVECSPMNFIPAIASKLFYSQSRRRCVAAVNQLLKRCERYGEEAKQNPPLDGDVKSVFDLYMDDGGARIDQEKIAASMLLFMPDGVSTSVHLIQFMFAYLLNYPKYHRMMEKEIEDLKGDSPILVADRQKMPVIESFIMEVFRIVTPFPEGFFVNPSKDTTFRGYNIPKNVKILPIFQAAHDDPKLFPEPHRFKPDRFIKNGKIGNTEGFMPFGTGRRMCMGEAIVRNFIFLYLSRMIQRYQILPSNAGPPRLDKDTSDLVVRPFPFKLRLLKKE